MKRFGGVVFGVKLLVFIIAMFFALTPVGLADGRFTRQEEEWKPFSVEGAQADFYVASDGNDSWSGKLPVPNADRTDGPFATIERAQEAVRRLKQEVFFEKKMPAETRYLGSPHRYGKGKDILVLIRGGYYALEKPLQFGPEDAGERCETDKPSGAFEYNLLKDYYVTYAAYPGEAPIIVGGKRIESWQKEQGKWVTYLKGMKIDKLFANGRQQVLARTPNEGYFEVAETPTNTTEFKFREGDIKKWPNMEGNRIILLLRWHAGINSIKEIDEEKNIAKLEKPQKGILEVPPRYYIENVETLVDAPGEWYFDPNTGKLSFIPEPGVVDLNKAFVAAASIPSIVVVKGEASSPVRNLRFSGLCFQATTSGGAAISFEYAKNCELLDSKVTGVGGRVIQIGKGSYGTRIYRNVIDGADGNGIYVSGDPRPNNWADIVDGTIISYNRLSNCRGIFAANTLNTTISHNELRDIPGRSAIYLGGWSNIEEAIDGGYRVEYNHIYRVLAAGDDAGAIKTAGQTSNSIIRANLIHDVRPSFFNENVAFWFDNWSLGWCVEDNIYYNLKQAPMKLCACTLSDNVYRDNFYIEEPVENEPEDIIEGEPFFEYKDLKISKGNAKTGEVVKVACTVTNSGATGIRRVGLFVDGKVADFKKFPVVHNNSRTIEFEARFWDPGVHNVAIGGLDDLLSTSDANIMVSGEPIQAAYGNLRLSEESGILPAGEELVVSADVRNVRGYMTTTDVKLYLDGKVIQTQTVKLRAKETQKVSFAIRPEKGIHKVSIGDADPVAIEVYPHHPVDITKAEWHTYAATRAKPCEFKVDPVNNHFEIVAGGTDFLHAEDSYGAIYLKGIIRGNFVATVKVVKYGEDVNPWYRAGIFVRNDISKSFETQPGSLGSVLMFTTPKVAQIQWDEFGDGCMHQMGSREKRIHEPDDPFPLWLKLVRHGDSFTGYISYDGKNWIKPRHAKPVPGLAKEMDIGLAAGTIDRRPSLVVLEDFTLEVEDEGWKENLK